VKYIGVGWGAWRQRARGANRKVVLRVLLGLVFFVLQFEMPSAFALSSACSAINSADTASYQANVSANQFAAGESVTVSFTDSGANAGGSQSAADYVMVEPGFGNGEIYYSSSPSPGFNTYSTTANLASTGLFVHLKTGTYITGVTLTCTASVSSVATLSNLGLSAGTLTPAFSSSQGSYAASVANSVASVSVTPITTDANATVTVNGATVPSGSASTAIGLTAGSATSIPVVVTAQDGVTKQTYTISVTRAAAAPVAGNQSITVAANSTNNTVNLNLSGGTATSVAVNSPPSHGTATASGTVITYTPTAGYSGSDSFTYNATNGSGTSAAATVTITVSAPTLTLTPAAGALAGGTVGTAYDQIVVSASGGTSPYSYTATGLPAGLTINASTGAITGTPTTSGSFTPTVTAKDTYNATGTVDYTIAVAGLAPVAGAVSTTVAANSTNNVITLALTGGAASSVSVVSSPAHGTAAASGTSITYTPASGYSGTDSFTYNATNGSGTSTAATVTITVSAPTLTLTPASGALTSGTVGTAYDQIVVSASGGTLPYSYTATGLPAGLTINASTGAITGTPTTSGSFTPTVTAKDAHSATGTATYTLTIAALPPVASSVSATVPANSTSNAVQLVVSGGAATSVAIVSAARHGVATASGTTITYTPNAGYSGTDSFTYSATNAAGSSTATVNITVTAPTLTVTPASGASLNATAGTAYTQAITVAGGASPYHFSASALPAGLGIDPATGTISGTPSATGTTTFVVTLTDANGFQKQVNYTLIVAGAAPVAVDRNATLYAGQTTTVNLTDGASGGPFTAAAIVGSPSASQGVATISGRAGAYTLTYAASAQASGAVLIRYTLTNAWGTSAPATVTLQVAARPDPSKDPEVIGLLNAQAQSAEQFADSQIDNFNDRLEQLHDERTRHSNSFNVQIGLPQSPAQAGGARPAQAPANNTQAAPSTPAGAARPATQDSGTPGLPHWLPDDRLAVWTGGFVNFGTSDRDEAQLSHTLVGLSAGADYRFLPSFTGGLGLGYGRDTTDVDSSGTQSRGEAFSAAFYGSYHPGPVYVDGLLGYSHLNFDSQRYVSETGGDANGERAGDQIFGALSSGYELRSGSALLAPYGRMQFSSTLLQHFTESGAGPFDLSYANQRLSMLSVVAGLRGEYGIPVSWGAIKLRGRIEYSHELTGSSEAQLGYADTADNSYSVTVLGLSENQLTAGLGVDFSLPFGLTTGLAYQGMFGMSDHTRFHEFIVHVAARF
jgi:uncharacterized protein with beta-barrel porin domain